MLSILGLNYNGKVSVKSNNLPHTSTSETGGQTLEDALHFHVQQCFFFRRAFTYCCIFDAVLYWCIQFLTIPGVWMRCWCESEVIMLMTRKQKLKHQLFAYLKHIFIIPFLLQTRYAKFVSVLFVCFRVCYQGQCNLQTATD